MSARAPNESSEALSILVVDDHRDGADSLCEFLRASGFDPEVVYSSSSALAAAATQMPDVFIADIGLPHLDGCELARRIVTLDGGPPLMIAVTGYTDLKDQCRLAGFDHFLIKPADPLAILALLHEAKLSKAHG